MLSLKLTRKIVLGFIVIAEVLVIEASLTGYRGACRALEEAAGNELQSAICEKGAAIGDFFGARIQELQTVATSPGLRRDLEVLATAQADSAAAHSAHDALMAALRPLTGTEQGFLSVSLCRGMETRVAVSTDPSEEGKVEPGVQPRMEKLKAPFIGAPYLPEKANMVAATFALPVPATSGGGDPAGVLVARMDLSGLRRVVLRRVQRHLTGDAFLINGEGKIATVPRFAKGSAILKTCLATEAVKRCTSGGSGLCQALDYRGVSALIAYRWLPRQQLGLIVKMNWDEVQTPARILGRQILSIAVGISVVGIALACGLANLIARPILRLTRAVARLGHGDLLDAPVFEGAYAEIDALVREFNSMALSNSRGKASLLANARELERCVAERTGELAFTNFDLVNKIQQRVVVEKELRAAINGAEASNQELAREIELRGQTEARLRLAKRAAETASALKTEFLANMSHEIRTPMNGVLGMTDLALDTPLTERQREYLTLIRHSGGALLEIVDGILDFAKIEAGRVSIARADFNLHTLIAETVKPLALRAARKNLELVADLSPSTPDALLGDPGRLRQVLVNLIDNAIKFTETGTVVLRVRPIASASAGEPDKTAVYVRFSVMDSGIGIASKSQSAVFEPFVQASAPAATRAAGTGLGLAICSELVGKMGGKLVLRSQLGRGSCFAFSARFWNNVAGTPTQPLQAGRERLAGLRILIADSNAVSRRVMVNLTRGWGMQPTPIADPEQAPAEVIRAAASPGPYQLVLLDAGRAALDDYALTKRIAALFLAPGTHGGVLLVLSPDATPSDADRARGAGARGILHKPIIEREFLEETLRCIGVTTEARSQIAAVSTAERRLRVLVVEDNPVNQHVTRIFLTRRGHDTVVVSNGAEAVEAAAHVSFDVILMDIQMPVMDGIEATFRIRMAERKRGNGAHIPIIALTAHAMSGDAERCLAAGMDCHLAKPFSRAELLHTVEQIAVHPGNCVPSVSPLSGVAGIRGGESLECQRLPGAA